MLVADRGLLHTVELGRLHRIGRGIGIYHNNARPSEYTTPHFLEDAERVGEMVKREAGRHNGKRRVRVWQRQDISLLPEDIRHQSTALGPFCHRGASDRAMPGVAHNGGKAHILGPHRSQRQAQYRQGQPQTIRPEVVAPRHWRSSWTLRRAA